MVRKIWLAIPLIAIGGVIGLGLLLKERKPKSVSNLYSNDVTFLTSTGERCGIATYTDYLRSALASRYGLDMGVLGSRMSFALRFFEGSETLLHVQHEWGLFPDVDVIRNAPVKHMVITWHTVISEHPFTTRMRQVDEKVDAHVVHTDLQRLILSEFTSKPIYVIPHGSAILQKFDKLEARKRLGLEPARRIGLAFGFVNPNKGLLGLVEVVRKVVETHPEFQLIITSAPHERAPFSAYLRKCKQLTEEYGLKDNIKWLGRFLSELEVDLYASASDLFIFNYINPHRYMWASASGAIHRIIGVGRPCVMTYEARTAEFIDGVHALKSEPNDTDAMARNIVRILESKTVADRLARNIRKYAYETRWSRIADLHYQLYKDIREGKVYEVREKPRRIGDLTEITQEYYDEDYFLTGSKVYYSADGKEKRWGYIDYGPWPGWPMVFNAVKRLFTPQRVLDVGCATGPFVHECLKNGVEAWGIDYSVWAISHPFGDAKGRILLRDVTHGIGFRDRQFDLVVCFDTLEHIYLEDLNKALDEIERVADRWLFFNICTAAKDDEVFSLKRGEKVPLDLQGIAVSGHVNIQKREWWLNLFKKRGWKNRDNMVRDFIKLTQGKLTNWKPDYLFIMEVKPRATV